MPDDFDVVQHPTLGELKFPKSMGMEERNKSIERLENQSDPSKTLGGGNVSAAGGAGTGKAPVPASLTVGDPLWTDTHKSALETSLNDAGKGNYKRAAHDVISGFGQGMLPVVAALGWEAPAATALTLGGGAGLQVGAQATYDKFGGKNPDTRNLIGDAAALGGSLIGGATSDLLPTPLQNMKVANLPGEVSSKSTIPSELGRALRSPGRINPLTQEATPGTLRPGLGKLPIVGRVVDAVTPANPNPVGYTERIPGRIDTDQGASTLYGPPGPNSPTGFGSIVRSPEQWRAHDQIITNVLTPEAKEAGLYSAARGSLKKATNYQQRIGSKLDQ